MFGSDSARQRAKKGDGERESDEACGEGTADRRREDGKPAARKCSEKYRG